MFHWICPECGQECAPSHRDCPSCYPAGESPKLQAGSAEVQTELAPAGPAVATAEAPEETPPSPSPEDSLRELSLLQPPLTEASAVASTVRQGLNGDTPQAPTAGTRRKARRAARALAHAAARDEVQAPAPVESAVSESAQPVTEIAATAMAGDFEAVGTLSVAEIALAPVSTEEPAAPEAAHAEEPLATASTEIDTAALAVDQPLALDTVPDAAASPELLAADSEEASADVQGAATSAVAEATSKELVPEAAATALPGQDEYIDVVTPEQVAAQPAVAEDVPQAVTTQEEAAEVATLEQLTDGAASEAAEISQPMAVQAESVAERPDGPAAADARAAETASETPVQAEPVAVGESGEATPELSVAVEAVAPVEDTVSESPVQPDTAAVGENSQPGPAQAESGETTPELSVAGEAVAPVGDTVSKSPVQADTAAVGENSQPGPAQAESGDATPELSVAREAVAPVGDTVSESPVQADAAAVGETSQPALVEADAPEVPAEPTEVTPEVSAAAALVQAEPVAVGETSQPALVEADASEVPVEPAEVTPEVLAASALVQAEPVAAGDITQPALVEADTVALPVAPASEPTAEGESAEVAPELSGATEVVEPVGATPEPSTDPGVVLVETASEPPVPANLLEASVGDDAGDACAAALAEPAEAVESSSPAQLPAEPVETAPELSLATVDAVSETAVQSEPQAACIAEAGQTTQAQAETLEAAKLELPVALPEASTAAAEVLTAARAVPVESALLAGVIAESAATADTGAVPEGRASHRLNTEVQEPEPRPVPQPRVEAPARAEHFVPLARPGALESTPARALALEPEVLPAVPARKPSLEGIKEEKAVALTERQNAAQKPVSWSMIGVVGTLMLLALLIGLSLYLFYFSPTNGDGARTVAASSTANASMVSPTAPLHPLTKYLEVTGLRVAVELNKKSTIQYLVVNHSAAEVAEATLNVIVRGANSRPQQPPVCAFRTKIPSLGPYESREYSAPIETQVRALEVPDWQNLRADVEVTTP